MMEKLLNQPVKNVLPQIQAGILENSFYFGIKTWKFPCDSWVYQQIIWELQPEFIVEIGNKYGGSLLMMAHWLDLMGSSGKLIGIDLNHSLIDKKVICHPRVSLVTGDALQVAEEVKQMIPPGVSVLVIEDSAHTEEFTLACLRAYSPLVQSGGYFIVEDSIINNGLKRNHPGPMPAIKRFLNENPDFESDRNREIFKLTWNPAGFLRRK